MSSFFMLAMVRVVSGMKSMPMPTPMKILGHRTVPKSTPRVKPAMRSVEYAVKRIPTMTKTFGLYRWRNLPTRGMVIRLATPPGASTRPARARSVAHERLEIDGQQYKRSEEVCHEDKHGDVAKGVGVVPEHTQIHNGPLGIALHCDEQGEREYRDECQGNHDV